MSVFLDGRVTHELMADGLADRRRGSGRTRRRWSSSAGSGVDKPKIVFSRTRRGHPLEHHRPPGGRPRRDAGAPGPAGRRPARDRSGSGSPSAPAGTAPGSGGRRPEPLSARSDRPTSVRCPSAARIRHGGDGDSSACPDHSRGAAPRTAKRKPHEPHRAPPRAPSRPPPPCPPVCPRHEPPPTTSPTRRRRPRHPGPGLPRRRRRRAAQPGPRPGLAAGDDGLAAEVATWNVAVQHTPASRSAPPAPPTSPPRSPGRSRTTCAVAVQATGHGPVRNAAGSLMITTRRMQGVHIDPERRIARVRPASSGCAVMEAAAEYGLAGAVRLVVRRRRRRATPSAAAWARSAASTASPPTTCIAVEIVTADGRLRRVTRRLRARAVLGGAGRQGQLRHRHRAGVRAGPGRRRSSAAASSSPATTPPRCCTASASGRRRCPRRSAPRSRSCGCRRLRGAAAAAARADRRPPAVRLRRRPTTPRPSGCSRR